MSFFFFFDVSSNNKTSLSRSESDAFIHHTRRHTQHSEGWTRFDIRFRCSHLFPFHFLLPHKRWTDSLKTSQSHEIVNVCSSIRCVAWWEYQRKAKRASHTNQSLVSLISLEIWRERHTNAASLAWTVKCRDSSIHLRTTTPNSEWELSWSAALDLTCLTDDEMKFLSHSFIHSLSVKISDVHLLPVLFGTRVNQTRASNTQPSIPHL